jgi:hypothetical protein
MGTNILDAVKKVLGIEEPQAEKPKPGQEEVSQPPLDGDDKLRAAIQSEVDYALGRQKPSSSDKLE